LPYVNGYVNPYARDLRTPRRLDGGITAGSASSGERSGRAERMRSRDRSVRPGRVLGGPSARAASGGNQSLP
jgi:hypothetical protein